jgi:UbiD family decarboxylase
LPSHLAAAATFQIGGNEADLAGGLGEQPVELIRCETSGLYVPASSEIVVEADVLPDRIAQEGPYGEYPGYRTGEMGHAVCARVTAITHRRQPILTVDTTGFKDSSSIVTSISGAVAIRRRLEKHGVPVTAVYVPPEGAVHLAVVAVKRGGTAIAQAVLETLTARRALMSKIIVVDDDVDVFNLAEVLHAFATKCHPAKGIHVTHYEGRANTLTPCYSQAERIARSGATVALDATWPPEWPAETTPVRATFDRSFPVPIQQKVLGSWDDELGL